jgi:hypothetical protein
LFLGVLERVVEIVLWSVPAIALSWPVKTPPPKPAPERLTAVLSAQPGGALQR